MTARAASLAVCALAAWGCASAPVRRVGDHLEGDPFWPRGPGRRIAWVGELKVPENLGIERGVWARVWAFLAGEEQSSALYRPFAVAIAADGRVAVADPGRRLVRVYEASKNRVLAASDGLKYPVALAFLGSTLLVADAETSQLLAFDSEGRPTRLALQLPPLGRPTGLAVDARRERLFIVDVTRHCVHVVPLSGAPPTRFGTRGGGLGQLNFPTAIAVDREGRVYVNDSMNFRVQVFDAQLEPVRAFGELGDGPGQLSKAKGIAVDREGIIYLVEASTDVVQAFDANGQLMGVFGGTGITPGRFWLPAGLAIDADNRLFVADTWNERVQVFALDRSAP